jgi:hypothetical protein
MANSALLPIPATTGLAFLPDIGLLSYNSVHFSCLYKTRQNGGIVPDEADRTTMYVRWLLVVEGHVTLTSDAEDTNLTTDDAMTALRQRLSVQGGFLTYSGRGFGPFQINHPGGGGLRDVCWGPKPKLLNFVPLGAGRGAFVTWQVEVCLPELPQTYGQLTSQGRPSTDFVLQWSYGYTLSYNDDGYSATTFRGTLEIPLTRRTVDDGTVIQTVDQFRQGWLDLQVDLAKFRVVRRSFDESPDKRLCRWEYVAEEMPFMGAPPYCTDARGTMSIRRGNKGHLMAALQWVVSLKATYTVRNDQPRRATAWAFYALWYYRMRQSANGSLAPMLNPANPLQQQAPKEPSPVDLGLRNAIRSAFPAISVINLFGRVFGKKEGGPDTEQRCLPIDFRVDEGLYLDSKTVTYEASWILMCNLRSLLKASGTWRWFEGTAGGDIYALSMQDVSGWRSWLANVLDPNQDLVVDLSGGSPPAAKLTI